MNKVIMLGRLTRDPEIRYSQGSNPTAIANYSLAVNRKFKKDGEPEADFFNCTSFGKIAELAEKYLKKGSQVCIVGHMQNDNYTNKDGNKVYSTSIIVEEMDFVGGKQSDSNSKNTSKPNPANASNSFMTIPDNIGDEYLPFN